MTNDDIWRNYRTRCLNRYVFARWDMAISLPDRSILAYRQACKEKREICIIIDLFTSFDQSLRIMYTIIP